MLLVSRQGKVRLAKWYTPMAQKECQKAVRDVCSMVIGRPSKLCNFLEWKDYKLVWKRCVSLLRMGLLALVYGWRSFINPLPRLVRSP